MRKHPIEVITSMERCRRWSREDKERLVAACFEPDAVISEFACAAGIHVSQLLRWRKELCRIGEPRSDTAALVPVIVSEAASTVSLAQPGPPTKFHPRRKRSDVTIELGRGRRVDSDIDTEALGGFSITCWGCDDPGSEWCEGLVSDRPPRRGSCGLHGYVDHDGKAQRLRRRG